MSAFPSSILVPQFDFECTFLRHISTDAISDCLEWKLRLSSFRGTGTQGTKQPYTKKLGQNFGAGISSQELCQDDILMTSSYRQNCLWPELILTSCFPWHLIIQLLDAKKKQTVISLFMLIGGNHHGSRS